MRGHGAEQGSTLIEAAVAVAIMATAVVSLAGLVSTAIRTASLARDRTSAATFAAQKLDQLMLPDAATPASEGVEYLDGTGAVVAASGGESGTVFVRQWAIRTWDPLSGVRLLRVTVARCGRANARPGPGCGDARTSVTLVTLKAEGVP